MESKVTTMTEAIARYVEDGFTIVIDGFTHLICFAAAHEIIRQKRRDLTLCRMTPDLIYDQMIAAGCASKLIFSWAGNPGAGSLFALRRAIEKQIPSPLEVEEYSHFGLAARLLAGAANLPFYPVQSYLGSDLPEVNPQIRSVTCPYTEQSIATVPALKPDTAIVHAQRADSEGNTQVWGITGIQKETAFAAKNVIVVVEELVDSKVVRADPNRTLIPGMVVDAVVVEPFGCHPSYVQGYYDRDNDFYIAWGDISRDPSSLDRYLDEWVYGVKSRSEYLEKLGPEDASRLKAEIALAAPVNYGY